MADTRITDAEIAGYMGWRGPGVYTEASLRKIREIIDHVLRAERATPPSPSTAPEVDEREAFEAKYRGLLDLTPCAENDGYMAYSTYCAWRAWKDRAALASRPADPSLKPVHERENAESLTRAGVDDEGLPPLPDPWHGFQFNSGWNSWEQVSHWAIGDSDVTRAYTEEQYRQGQRDAVAADRARMPDPKEISDAITEAYNVAYVDRDWKATDYWRGLGKRFSAWAALAPDANKKAD